jgi:hypothetical protein
MSGGSFYFGAENLKQTVIARTFGFDVDHADIIRTFSSTSMMASCHHRDADVMNRPFYLVANTLSRHFAAF